MYKKIILTILIILIVVAIWYLEGQKADIGTNSGVQEVELAQKMQEEKADKYESAKELVDNQGFINSEPFKLADYIGEKVILVDFWTYSCINCQRTTPYLNAWWDKYQDQGLLIVGVHTPEFEFEKDYDNVRAATQKFNIEYPIVQDNNYTTWRAYANRYWPRKYLIDIDGYIVYDHIGEGAYEETEKKIQELLRERLTRLGEEENLSGGTVRPVAEVVDPTRRKTPEIYFGASRNLLLGSGPPGQSGKFSLEAEQTFQQDRFYLAGDWQITSEYAENLTSGATITLRYQAQKVFMVAGSEESVQLKLKLDGHELGANRGADVTTDDQVALQAETLYRLIESAEHGEHVLEISIKEPGLRVFTFTFG